MQRFLKQPTLYLAVLIIGSTGGCTYLKGIQATQAQQSNNSSLPNVVGQAGAPPNNLNFIAEVVREEGAAVVRIDATRTVNVPGGSGNPLIERFFGSDAFPPEQRVQRGVGSGFIVTGDGRILTNSHVVANADQVAVVLKDGRRFEGKVVGADPVTDVAVVKIDATNLPTVKLGKSDNIVPGQWAMGDKPPLALARLVTL